LQALRCFSICDGSMSMNKGDKRRRRRRAQQQRRLVRCCFPFLPLVLQPPSKPAWRDKQPVGGRQHSLSGGQQAVCCQRDSHRQSAAQQQAGWECSGRVLHEKPGRGVATCQLAASAGMAGKATSGTSALSIMRLCPRPSSATGDVC